MFITPTILTLPPPQRSSLSPPHSHDSPQHASLLRGQVFLHPLGHLLNDHVDHLCHLLNDHVDHLCHLHNDHVDQGEGASYDGRSSPGAGHPQLPPSHTSPLRSPQSPGSRLSTNKDSENIFANYCSSTPQQSTQGQIKPMCRSHSMYEYRDPNPRPPTGPTSLPGPSNYRLSFHQLCTKEE